MDSSKNEIIIAVFLGILIGFIAVLGFYFVYKNRGQQSATKQTIVKLTDKQDSSNSQKNIVANFDLTVDPTEAEVTSQVSDFKINGATDKNATVIVQTDDDVLTVKPDSDGNFSTKITLTKDITQVFITSVLGNQEKTLEKIIYYDKKQ